MEKKYLNIIGVAALVLATSGTGYATSKVDLNKVDSPALRQSIESVVNDYNMKINKGSEEYLMAGPCGFFAFDKVLDD